MVLVLMGGTEMRKKHLIENLHRAEARIKELEEIICPAHQHQWFEDYQEECYICTKCKKVRWMDWR